MKLKLTLIIFGLFFYQNITAQSSIQETDASLIETHIDVSIYTLKNDSLSFKNYVDLNNDVLSPSNDLEQWKVIKQKLKKNKEQVLSNNKFFVTKVLDTIYVEMRIERKNTSLTDW